MLCQDTQVSLKPAGLSFPFSILGSLPVLLGGGAWVRIEENSFIEFLQQGQARVSDFVVVTWELK